MVSALSIAQTQNEKSVRQRLRKRHFTAVGLRGSLGELQSESSRFQGHPRWSSTHPWRTLRSRDAWRYRRRPMSEPPPKDGLYSGALVVETTFQTQVRVYCGDTFVIFFEIFMILFASVRISDASCRYQYILSQLQSQSLRWLAGSQTDTSIRVETGRRVLLIYRYVFSKLKDQSSA